MAGFTLKDNSQALQSKGSGIINITQVDRDGAVLASGTDFFGNAYASVYELPFLNFSAYKRGAPSTMVNDEASQQVGSSSGNLTAEVSGEFIGNLYKFNTGSIFHVTNWLLLSGLDGVYWKMATYEPIEGASAVSGATKFIKTVYWMGKFESVVDVRMAGEGQKLMAWKYIPEVLASKSLLALSKGGQVWQEIPVNATQAYGSETFESQTPATA